ncbi:MAG: glutamate N-acetyltransferase / amino-acid N-acetyltransferase [Actinomycetota bacterium]|jgi:glutamate N-acetyltransferase/amino-acid N-acetyltransferase|nr:glutamate N-acetyltransferase / amino-acid N-acetyltransferase [Actinomycetota bacterium]
MRWPTGFTSSGVAAGIKPNGDKDLAVLVTEAPVQWAGTFTHNASAAACVHWCRGQLGHPVRAIVVNSGNANACTGKSGAAAVEETAMAAADALGCSRDEILVSSTGTIGIPLPVERLTSALPGAFAGLGPDVGEFGHAIMTTDSRMKVATAGAGDATVVGVAKGAAMLAPNMATMLAFMTTDAAVPDGALQKVLTAAVGQSFDRISVDACESTNDSVFLLSSSAVETTVDALARAVTEVCKDLAEQMVRDAEGGSKFVRIQVTGAADDAAAVSFGRSIAASALWRAAVNGADPNWGRVLAALGSVDRTLDISEVTVAIGPETLFDRGEPCGSIEAAHKAMSGDEFTLSCVVGGGTGVAEILSSDLSTDYVTLNAEGST